MGLFIQVGLVFPCLVLKSHPRLGIRVSFPVSIGHSSLESCSRPRMGIRVLFPSPSLIIQSSLNCLLPIVYKSTCKIKAFSFLARNGGSKQFLVPTETESLASFTFKTVAKKTHQGLKAEASAASLVLILYSRSSDNSLL